MLIVNPLVSIPVAQALLGKDEDEITEAAEDGLLVAWNIGLGPGRREIRILYPSLVWFATLQNVFPGEPAGIVDSIFPPDLPVTTLTLRSTLSCGGTHVGNLIRAKAFNLAPGQQMRPGVGGVATVDRPSVVKWLKSRLI